jgi:hypothetical protein
LEEKYLAPQEAVVMTSQSTPHIVLIVPRSALCGPRRCRRYSTVREGRHDALAQGDTDIQKDNNQFVSDRKFAEKRKLKVRQVELNIVARG